jgi:hypothetical protein
MFEGSHDTWHAMYCMYIIIRAFRGYPQFSQQNVGINTSRLISYFPSTHQFIKVITTNLYRVSLSPQTNTCKLISDLIPENVPKKSLSETIVSCKDLRINCEAIYTELNPC